MEQRPGIRARGTPKPGQQAPVKNQSAVDNAPDKTNLRGALRAISVQTGVHVAAALVLFGLWIGYTGITRGTNYAHYTSWSFMLCTLYVTTDLVGWMRQHVSPILGPLAYAVSQSVACLTAGMYAADSGLVADAYAKHNDGVVEFMNLVLHVFPAVVVLLLLVRTRTELAATVRRDDYILQCVFVALCFCGIYFYSFSPRHQYMVIASNTVIRSSVMVIHALFAALGAWAVLRPLRGSKSVGLLTKEVSTQKVSR
jgi:hypothetical protein